MFYSKADLKNFTKHSLKRNCDEVIFFQLNHNLRFTEKEIHHSYFPMTFPRLFIILICLKTLVKSCKGLKGTEAFAQIWVEKNWSRKFHKIQPKETVIMSFFTQVASCNLNRTSSQLFSDVFCKIFQNTVFVRNSEHW